MGKKKSFIDDSNPALSFISKETIDAIDAAQGAAPAEAPAAAAGSMNAIPEINLDAFQTMEELAERMGVPSVEELIEKIELAKKGERRTRRVQIVLKPSVYAAAKKRSEEEGISFNDYIHGLIEKDLGKEG